MIKISFTKKDQNELQYLRYNHIHPRVQQRAEVLLLKSKGMKNKDIEIFADVAPNTITSYLKMFKEGGIDKIQEVSFYKPGSKLEKFSMTLKEYFKEHPPTSLLQAMKFIEEITGIKRGKTQVWNFLRNMGMKCRKVGGVPARADTENQIAFKKNTWILE